MSEYFFSKFIFILLQCDKAVRAELLANITLSGGNTKFPGMEKRVYQVIPKTHLYDPQPTYVTTERLLYHIFEGAGGAAASANSEGSFEGSRSSTPRLARLGGRGKVQLIKHKYGND